MSNDKPKVSIVVPVYNCESYIEKCIQSLLNQTYRNLEIILINDGSTDQSLAIINRFVEKDDRIICVCQENQGVAIARNNGISKAIGKYILFVDGDDYLELEYVAVLVRSAECHNSDLVVAGYRSVGVDGKVIRNVMPQYYHRKSDEMSVYRICAVCSRLYLRSFWMNYDLKFISESGARGEDTPISLYANLMARNITVINNCGYNYLQHEGSAMDELRGLKKYHFPFETMHLYLERAWQEPNENSRAFFAFGVYKFFAQFVFDFSWGASKESKRELIKYILLMNSIYLREEYLAVKKILYSNKTLSIQIRLAVLLLLFKIKKQNKE